MKKPDQVGLKSDSGSDQKGRSIEIVFAPSGALAHRYKMMMGIK